ncbi:MAG: OmpL47-type beta-barrel domain-containing protein [Pyrinomonadaceae bacterium]
MLRFTSKGVEPLRYDRDGDGIYESIASATVVASGSEARDITPPVVKFSEQLKGAKRKVTIKATDSGSGVKIIYYSLDNKRYQPYLGPLVLDSGNPPMIYAFADDRVGNRSSVASPAN